jgi:hypothetical protein
MNKAIEDRDNAPTTDERIKNEKAIRYLQAEQLKEFYSFVISEKLYAKINSHAVDIDMKN